VYCFASNACYSGEKCQSPPTTVQATEISSQQAIMQTYSLPASWAKPQMVLYQLYGMQGEVLDSSISVKAGQALSVEDLLL
jgi:hypothetical protein